MLLCELPTEGLLKLEDERLLTDEEWRTALSLLLNPLEPRVELGRL